MTAEDIKLSDEITASFKRMSVLMTEFAEVVKEELKNKQERKKRSDDTDRSGD